MGRRSGPHQYKLEMILYVLKAHPQGLWVREISRISGLKKSTVSYYLQNYLNNRIEIVHQTNHIKIIKLKATEQGPSYCQ
ncbi:MAG: helix-turn-helix domain-containing protein [Candidatus Nanoarchaeia archaeon]